MRRVEGVVDGGRKGSSGSGEKDVVRLANGLSRVMRRDRVRDTRRCAESTHLLWAVRTWTLRTRILRRVAVRRIGRNGSYDGEIYALRFAEKGHENKRGKNGAL